MCVHICGMSTLKHEYSHAVTSRRHGGTPCAGRLLLSASGPNGPSSLSMRRSRITRCSVTGHTVGHGDGSNARPVASSQFPFWAGPSAIGSAFRGV
jgi:hypothetical protein